MCAALAVSVIETCNFIHLELTLMSSYVWNENLIEWVVSELRRLKVELFVRGIWEVVSKLGLLVLCLELGEPVPRIVFNLMYVLILQY